MVYKTNHRSPCFPSSVRGRVLSPLPSLGDPTRPQTGGLPEALPRAALRQLPQIHLGRTLRSPQTSILWAGGWGLVSQVTLTSPQPAGHTEASRPAQA